MQARTMGTIFVVSGPAGSGKTTVGTYLSKHTSAAFLEGDDYHDASNKNKMSKGIPLTDSDRWDWLIALRQAAVQRLPGSQSAVVSCSALRRKYRDVFRTAAYFRPNVRICFIYLKVDEARLYARVRARAGHYMKEDMVRSQVETLEEPSPDEFDVVVVDTEQDKEDVCKEALERARSILDQVR